MDHNLTSSKGYRKVEIFFARMNIKGFELRTFEEVGKEFGDFRQRIQQIEAECLEIIRKFLKLEKEDFFRMVKRMRYIVELIEAG